MVHYSFVIKSVLVHMVLIGSAICEVEYNNLNSDGSFSFRHSNNDIGSYYHSVAGNSDNSVRGRYGSRNPSSGRVEETVYTAGPRGFRVNGPQVHRKMDLSQIPRGRIGSAEDPLADPYDDPTYSFKVKTPDYFRNEESDSNGRIKGLYSYFDDTGEKHIVRYAAGAGTGFEVVNGVPDIPSSIAYSAPLYNAPPKTHGKVSIQRGPYGTYKFIATGPDQRRSEETGPDGLVRGSYSYLDDKGVQRTVEYEAGAGIGYRIIHNSVGHGTHRKTHIPNFNTPDAFDKISAYDNQPDKTLPNFDKSSSQKSYRRQNVTSVLNKNSVKAARRGGVKFRNTAKNNINDSANTNLFSTEYNGSKMRKKPITDISKEMEIIDIQNLSQNQNRKYDGPTNGPNDLDFDNDLSSIPPLITSNERILEIGRDEYWKSRNKDSTIIKNVGKWYIGLPPGQSVRAHVQNIDILPIGSRILSPSEALRKHELPKKSK